MNMPEAKRSLENDNTVDGGMDRNRPAGNSYSVAVSGQRNTPDAFGDFDYEALGDPSNYCLPEDERFPD